jgi:hypothetical protein
LNKTFVREPDHTGNYCPRCGSQGEQVGAGVLSHYLTDEQRHVLSEPANFCPSPNCAVAYFDGFERFFLTAALSRPIYPKDPTAPICACFGLTRQDIEQDVDEGGVTRTKAVVEKAKSPAARCSQMPPVRSNSSPRNSSSSPPTFHPAPSMTWSRQSRCQMICRQALSRCQLVELLQLLSTGFDSR